MTQIAAWRGSEKGVLGFWHHGIECTDGSIIHFDGRGVTGKKTAEIICTSMEVFMKHSKSVYDVIYDQDVFDPETVTERAKSKLGQRGYHLTFNNCESFAKWCMTGKDESEQIRHYLSGVLVGKKLLGPAGVIMGVGCAAVTQKFFRRKMIQRQDPNTRAGLPSSSRALLVPRGPSEAVEGNEGDSESVSPVEDAQTLQSLNDGCC